MPRKKSTISDKTIQEEMPEKECFVKRDKGIDVYTRYYPTMQTRETTSGILYTITSIWIDKHTMKIGIMPRTQKAKEHSVDVDLGSGLNMTQLLVPSGPMVKFHIRYNLGDMFTKNGLDNSSQEMPQYKPGVTVWWGGDVRYNRRQFRAPIEKIRITSINPTEGMLYGNTLEQNCRTIFIRF